jgi:flagellar capping protein FliD
LFNNSTLSLARSRIESEVSGIVEGLASGNPSRLADLGITFVDSAKDDTNPLTKNILVVDEAKLDAAIASNFDAVRKVFEFDYSSDNPDLQVFQRNNGLAISAFTLSINQTTGDNNIATANKVIALDGTAVVSGTGVVLTGRSGTVLEGLTLIYGQTGNTTVHVNVSQGIGDRLYNSTADLLDETKGAVAVEINSLSDKNTRIKADITRIDQQVATYRDRLLNQYAALESSITKANNLLQSLQAQSDARNNG